MFIEFVLLIWCIIITVMLITVIHCQNNQSDILKLLNDELVHIKQYLPDNWRKEND